ncbi:SiaB family protein kinase [Halocola ammonii]
MDNKIDVFEFYDRMERENIMISFKGDMNTELLDAILQVAERKLQQIEDSAKVRKRVFNILVECLQNLYHHIEQIKFDHKKDSETPSVIVMIARTVRGFSIMTGNFILNDEIDKLKDKLQEINEMDRKEIKSLYKKVLSSGTRTSKGGGGLGIIDIARKSDNKLEYGFIPFDSVSSFFSLNVKVSS